jgi:hypothetical protein
MFGYACYSASEFMVNRNTYRPRIESTSWPQSLNYYSSVVSEGTLPLGCKSDFDEYNWCICISIFVADEAVREIPGVVNRIHRNITYNNLLGVNVYSPLPTKPSGRSRAWWISIQWLFELKAHRGHSLRKLPVRYPILAYGGRPVVNVLLHYQSWYAVAVYRESLLATQGIKFRRH